MGAEVTALQAALLVAGAVGAGALNSVAGGGTFLVFPLLVFNGVPPIRANATSTVALWPASVAGAYGFRKELKADRRTLWALGLASLLGGTTGAVLLLVTPQAKFTALVPVLLLLATLLFTFGNTLVERLRRGGQGHPVGLGLGTVFQFVVAVYGGYFGAGMGIVMLALYSLMPVGNIHRMNGLKNIMGTILNGLAIVVFMVAGAVEWRPGLLMTGGGIVGGYLGAVLAQKVAPSRVRALVTVIAWGMTAYFFWKYR